jgi:hypothetical protein
MASPFPLDGLHALVTCRASRTGEQARLVCSPDAEFVTGAAISMNGGWKAA